MSPVFFILDPADSEGKPQNCFFAKCVFPVEIWNLENIGLCAKHYWLVWLEEMEAIYQKRKKELLAKEAVK